MKRTTLKWLSGCMILATLGVSCAGGSNEPVVGDDLPPLEDDLAPIRGAKDDTGYLSDLAAELEAVFSGRLVIDVSELAPADQQARFDELTSDEWELRRLADRQIKYAKGQINTDVLHMNLSSSDAEIVDAKLDGGKIVVDYAAALESIITVEDLAETGRELTDVINDEYHATLPSDPGRMASDVGAACLKDGHSDAEDYNYFYYYEPEKAGCADAMAAAGVDRVLASLKIINLAPKKTVFPEYDKLTADGRIDVVVFFGAADHDWEPGQWDWGTAGHSSFTRNLSSRGFRKMPAEHGDLYTRTEAGLEENVIVVGPETLKLLKHDADGLFEKLVSKSEIIMYNGHSFYGSLNVLDNPAVYTGQYQIFFMNSCWSYEYYTKQIFQNNVTDEDPEGWANADVVNDTESGWFHNMEPTSRILLTNLLRGAETGGEENGRTYDWEGIISAMNKHALDAQKRRGTETHEVYGVSGVTTNRYTPGAVVEPPTPGAQRFEFGTTLAIPDNDRDGATATLPVDAAGVVKSAKIDLAINHTFRGDLTIELHHAGRSVTVFDGTTADRPSDDNVVVTAKDLAGFQGVEAGGEWLLTVVDHAAIDTGTLTRFSLELETE